MQANLPSWDIDDNGQTDALTDGLLVLRYLFGFRGQTLTTGAIASDAQNNSDAMIEQQLSQLSIADIDGDGNVDALTDGLLLLRYLFGFRGDTLINGAMSSEATRNTTEVEDHIGHYMR